MWCAAYLAVLLILKLIVFVSPYVTVASIPSMSKEILQIDDEEDDYTVRI